MRQQDSLEVIADSFEFVARRELKEDHGVGFRVCVFTSTHMYTMPEIDPNSKAHKAFLGDMVRWFVRKYKGQAVALVSEAWTLIEKPDKDTKDLDADEYMRNHQGSLGDNPNSVEVLLISVTSPLGSVSRMKQFDRDEDGTPHNLRPLDLPGNFNLAAGNFSDFFGDHDLNEEEKKVAQAWAKQALRKGERLDRSGLKFAAPKSARLHQTKAKFAPPRSSHFH